MNIGVITRGLLPFAMASPAALATAADLPPAAAVAFPWPNGARAAVVLTYDDGMDTHLDHAAPDLEAAGLRGTFFVPGHSESLAKRMPEWRALAARGHELANHAIFHPCLRKPASGAVREWVKPEYALEGYTVERIRDEVAAMNTTLLAIDGETVRTFAYNCCDTTAGGQSYVESLRPLFLAARAGEDRIAADVRALDPMLVPSWAAENVSGRRARRVRAEGRRRGRARRLPVPRHRRPVDLDLPRGPPRARRLASCEPRHRLDGHLPAR